MTDRSNKPKSNTETIPTEQWQSEFTAHIVKEVFGLIKEEERVHGIEFGASVRLSMVASCVSTIVYSTMIELSEDGSKLNTKQQVDAAHESYLDVKEAVEAAVASGFQGAMHIWTGVDREYMCEVNPVLQPINKLEC